MSASDGEMQLISFDRMKPGERGIFRSSGRLLHCEKHPTKDNVLTVWGPSEPHKRLDNVIDEKRAKFAYVEVLR